MPADLLIEPPGTHGLNGIPVPEDFFHHQLNVVKVLLRLQRVVDAVVARFVKLNVIHARIVAIVLAAGCFHQSVRHERAGGDNGVDQSAVNQIADDQPLLGDCHRPGQGHHHKAVFVARHGFQHVNSLAELAPGKRRIGHAAHQRADGPGFGQVERKNRRQLVLHWVVQLAVNTCAFTLLGQRVTSTEWGT